MKNAELNRLANVLKKTLTKSEISCAAAFDAISNSDLSIPQKMERQRELATIVGTLQGDIAYVMSELMDEVDRKKNKKFYQFWK